jgi:hypothetical protein
MCYSVLCIRRRQLRRIEIWREEAEKEAALERLLGKTSRELEKLVRYHSWELAQGARREDTEEEADSYGRIHQGAMDAAHFARLRAQKRKILERKMRENKWYQFIFQEPK